MCACVRAYVCVRARVLYACVCECVARASACECVARASACVCVARACVCVRAYVYCVHACVWTGTWIASTKYKAHRTQQYQTTVA